MEGKAKVHYARCYGRAEPIRFALSATGVDFEEVELMNKLIEGEEGEKDWQEKKKNYEFE